MGRAMFFVSITTAAILAALLFMRRRAHRARPTQIKFLATTTIKQSNEEAATTPVNEEPEAIPVSYSGSNARMQIRAVVLAAALFIAAIAAVLFAVNPTEDGNTLEPPSLAEGPTVAPQITPTGETPATASSSPEPGPTVQPVGVDVTRLRLPTLGIDAPIVTMGVDQSGTMQSPNNPTDVAWYNFSARPGEMSNVVMAGHLDYVNYGPAVFYRLKEARPGDEVELVLVDGSVARYRVEGVTSYDEATAPVLDIVGPTDVEMVTLITCGGSFDPLSREYDKRVVLRAERIYESAQAN